MAAAGAASAAGVSGVAGLVESPRGAWMFADGSLLPKAEFPELYAVIGGGCGTSPALFRLPDLAKVEVLVPRQLVGVRYLIKVRPGDDDIPIGTILAYVGSGLPDWG